MSKASVITEYLLPPITVIEISKRNNLQFLEKVRILRLYNIDHTQHLNFFRYFRNKYKTVFMIISEYQNSDKYVSKSSLSNVNQKRIYQNYFILKFRANS